jgi:hypothetical protein
MDDVIALQSDLTPRSRDELRVLAADLNDDGRHVLLEHSTEAPKAAPAGRALPVRFLEPTSDPSAISATV